MTKNTISERFDTRNGTAVGWEVLSVTRVV